MRRRGLLLRMAFAVGCSFFGVAPSGAAEHPNVLFIAIDDLNDWVGPLKGHPLVKTPAMDKLAARGVNFTNAHCQAPLCNPSRTSVMTGLRPSTTGVYGLAPWFRTLPEFADRLTLFEHFKQHGYDTYSVGKIYHMGAPPPRDRARELTEVGNPRKVPRRPDQPFVKTPAGHPLMDWGPFPERDDEHPDWQIASWAVEKLKSSSTEPFFLAVGFHLPHVPCFAPQAWFDLYPDTPEVLPPILANDRDDTPLFSWYLHWTLPEPRESWLRASGELQPLARAYLATVSFIDSQVGRVLDALDKAGLTDETIVVLWSDHGWHVGEKGISGKNSLWERSTRVPLIFAGPGIVEGRECHRPAELLDLYPTLCELSGLPVPEGQEGHSLLAQLQDPEAEREFPAITTHNQGNHTVRTEYFRYIQYADGSEELYDMRVDPNEWTNLVGRPGMELVLSKMREWLPEIDVPPAAGSAHRILTYDPETGQAVWEGEPIVPSELER